MSNGAQKRLALVRYAKELVASTPMPGAVQKARGRFGKAFAHELGSDYKHSHTPKVLEEWLRGRK